MKLPRVYPILDGALLAARGISMADAAVALVDAGARLLQFRWKGHFNRTVFDEAVRVNGPCVHTGATLIVNDRADIAVMLRAGVHLGQDDLPPEFVRTALPGASPVGISTHNEMQFCEADSKPVDYIALGPIFGTSNKANPDPVVGTTELARLRKFTDKPVVAIGGITRANVREVWSAGADAVAVIGDMYPEPCTTASIKKRFAEWARIAADE